MVPFEVGPARHIPEPVDLIESVDDAFLLPEALHHSSVQAAGERVVHGADLHASFRSLDQLVQRYSADGRVVEVVHYHPDVLLGPVNRAPYSLVVLVGVVRELYLRIPHCYQPW